MTSLKLEQNLAPLRIPFKDILIATKDFAKENLIDQGGIADVYKGLLLRSGVPIDVVIRRFCRPCPGLEKQHFLKEINTLSSLKHSNFVSIVGFCDENDEMMIIMERADNGSLENHLSDPTTLTWSRRLYICVGVALALRYVHSDVRNVFHHDIKSSKILLNKEWFAKLFCFGFFVRYRVVFRYTSVYTDPDYIKTGICREDRSDAYSLGVILLEVLCGKKATIEDVIRYRDQMELEEGKLDNIYIDPNLREQMHMQSLSMFSKTAYDCLKEERNQRPSIDEIVERLQIALELQVKHENRARNVDYLRIPLREITMATDCFAETYLIRSHIHDHVYKAELNHFDRDNVLTKEGENKGELPKKKVIIKRIYNYKKSKEDFLAEIQMISSYKHPNLIPLLGFCDEESEMIVVFECAFKETLHHYLRSTSNRTNLTWEQRIRICLDITHGLKYLHNMMEDKLSVIHQRIQSANVFFDEKLTAKIVCFKLFESYGTSSLWDSAMDAPSDFSDQRCVENDIYSLGLILFEILTGRLAEDTARRHFNGGTLRNIADPGLLEEDPGLLEEAQEWSCTRRKGPNQDSFDIFSENQCLEETPSKRPKLDEVINSLEKEPVKGLVHVARRHFDKGTLWNIADPDLMEEAQEWSCTPRKGPNQDSFDIFSEIAYQCSEETPSKRPKLDDVISSLQKAFRFQAINVDYLRIPLREITMATDCFAETYLIQSHIHDHVYEAELNHFDRKSVLTMEREKKGDLPKKKVIIKRIYNYKKSKEDFLAEIKIISSYKHPNVVSLLGFCDEGPEMIVVFECAFKETLHHYLRSMSNRTNLTWEQRIRICLDIAHGLKYLHIMFKGKSSVMHQRIQSANVLFDEKLTAKIVNFKLFEFDLYHTSSLWDSAMYAPTELSDQLIEDDIYSLGLILFEILTGRLAHDWLYMTEPIEGLAHIARRHFNEGTLRNIADPDLLEEAQEWSYTPRKGPNQDSFDIFSEIAYQCLEETPSERPTLDDVINSLEKAFHFQAPFDHMKIPLDAIQLATNNFDEKYLIGSGGFGEVYKAELKHVNIRCSLAAKMKSEDEYPKLPNTVAIKRIFHREDGQGKEGFLAELEVLSKWEHPNIVNLLGICVERDERLLVYEHASNGSLDGFLGSNNNMINLTWAQRLRVCIDIAHGLSYLHTTMVDKKWIIHRDIKSDNILLGENWEAKIADFGLSKYPANQQESTINTNHIAGTYVYLDPEYARTGRLKKESDIYSFGVVLFEIFSGTLAYDPNYIKENEKGLAPIIQRHFQMGTIKEMLDTKIMEEADELGFTGKVGPDHDSLKAFLKIAYQCLAKAQGHRPTTEVIITELSKALHFQENRIKTLKISLEDIKLGVKNFSVDNCIVRGGYGMLYNGEIQYNKRRKKVLVKRFCLDKYLKHTKFSCFMSMEHGFMKEFEVLFKHKQENIIGLVGYCKEMNEKIIVYENASNGSLDKYLNDASFSWTERLKVCIDIAKGLRFLHGDDVGKDVVIHRDIKSSNILLNKDWNAKICGFELALTYPIDEVMKYAIDHVVGSPGYCDPLYWETHMLTKESDMYSFGVVLFEILCGRLACPKDFRDQSQFLDVLVKRQFKVARLDEIVFEGIKEKIAPKSLSTFRRIAFRCLHEDRKERPTAGQVLVQLQEALEIQEAYVILEGAKLRSNYKEVLRFSNSTNYSTMAKRYINDILSKGILLEEDKQEIIRVLQQPT